MKGKTLIALIIAVLMVTSIVSASAFANLGTLIYNRIAPQDPPLIQTITSGQTTQARCASQTDCPNGNCVCKCAAKPAASNPGVLSSLTGKATIPISNLKLSPGTASSGTLIATTGKAAGVSCTTASECTSKICGRATTSASKVCKTTCSLASDCETGKACTTGKCVTPVSPRTAGQICSANLPCATGLACTSGKCTRPAAAGSGSVDSVADASGSADTSVGSCQSACLARCRAACTPSAPSTCTTNADCTTGYCRIVPSSTVPSITGTCVPCTTNTQCGTGKTCTAATGQCAAKPAASNPGVLSSLTGKATIPISNLKLSPGTASSGTLIATTGKAAGVSCTTASECTSKICGRATTSASKVCKTTCSLASDCETGKACTSGKCVTPVSPRTAGQTCSANLPCATGLTCDSIRKVCVTSAIPRTAGQSCTANQLCATGLSCTSGICTTPAAANTGDAVTNADTSTVGRCQAACTESCRLECTPSGEQTPPPAGSGVATTGTKIIGEICSSPTGCVTECESGYGECSCEGTAVTTGRSGRKQNNEACDSSPQCISGYCDKIFPDRTGICSIEGTTGAKIIGEECNAHNQCESGFCWVRNVRTGFTRTLSLGGGPDATCAEPLEKDIEIGESCFTHSQCKSNHCEGRTATEQGTCTEAPPVPKLPLGERCVDNEDCESNYCYTDPETIRKTCAEQAVEALSPEAENQLRTELAALEPKVVRLEQQVVADGLVASREALVAMSGRPDCYVTINDVELKAECIKIRFETVTTLLESRGQITAEQARNWKGRVASQGQAVGQEKRAEALVSPPPAAQVSFGSRVKNLFRFTGSFWRVTGGFVVEETEVQVGTAGEELQVIQAIPTNYLNDLDTQYNDLAILETTICAGYPTTLTSASVLKSCSTNLQCGASGAVKCVSGKCRVDKADVCTVGEFTGIVAPPETKIYGEACAANTECLTGLCRTVQGTTPTCACTTNANCPTGQRCASPGICISTTRKIYGETCSTGAECESNQCVSRAGTRTCACTANTHCLVGQICTAEMRCVTDIPASTEEGYGTVDIPTPCAADATCGTGKACINSICLTGKALGDRTCRNNIECASKYCARTLNDPEDEESGTFRSCSLCGVDANCDTGRTCSAGVCQ